MTEPDRTLPRPSAPVGFVKAWGRVYVGPEPVRGYNHCGWRGMVWTDYRGVHIGPGCEYLPDSDDPEQSWEPWDSATTIPWHRVDQIEWDEAPDE